MLFGTTAFALATLVAATSARSTKGSTYTFTPTNYTVVPGFFEQDNADFKVATFTGYSKNNFGIIDKSKKRWTNLEKKVKELNSKADRLTAYKLVYLARHGEGYHNLAESTYGTPAWNCYWSLKTTDGNITWGPDAVLTSTGLTQAQLAHTTFTNEISSGMPVPQVLYSSPMRRSALTLQITWDKYITQRGSGRLIPQVREALRESIGLHTCDQRSEKSVIEKQFPKFEFEEPFSLHDELWGPDYQESNGQQPLRMQQWLNKVFATDDSMVISVTAHSGVIKSIFKAINHNIFSVETGGVVPVIIKAVGHATASNTLIIGGPSATAPVCDATVSLPASATATARV